MVVDFIINTIGAFIDLILTPLPSLPALDLSISSAIDSLLTAVEGSVSIVTFIFSPVLTVAIFTVIAAWFVFEPLYAFIMWALRKIPVINIK